MEVCGQPWEELPQTPLPASPKALASAFSDKGLTTPLEDDPVVFSGRIPGLEAPEDDGGIDVNWQKVREAAKRPFTSSVLSDWGPSAKAQCLEWPCLLTNGGSLG